MRRIACAAALACATAFAWTPPADPDPRQILREAHEDAIAGRYADALEKQLWFHREALKQDSGFYGVRLSFALFQWKELGAKYPPALDALRAIRDESAEQVKRSPKSFPQFSDVSAINGVLGEVDKTAELFAWVDENRPDFAKQLYFLAQRSLVVAKKYALCGKYLSGPADTDRITGMYRMNRGMERQAGSKFADYARNSFTNSAATLVALLAVNGRQAEADTARAEFLKEISDESFREQLNRAAAGAVPDPWPPLGGGR